MSAVFDALGGANFVGGWQSIRVDIRVADLLILGWFRLTADFHGTPRQSYLLGAQIFNRHNLRNSRDWLVTKLGRRGNDHMDCDITPFA